MKSLYVHIPFCFGSCDYCDFLSFPLRDWHLLRRYLEILASEMSFYRGEQFETLYLGGGTPSTLIPEHIDMLSMNLRSNFTLDGVREFTLEANPETVDAEKIGAWLRAGVNRLTLGVQSFDDAVLAANRRNCRTEDVYRAFQLLRRAGFANIGLDLILGLQPSYDHVDIEAVASIFREDVRRAVSLSPEHISVYLLSLTAGSKLGTMNAQGRIVLLDERTIEELYLFTVRFLAAHGYEQYEISNFARPGYESEHNLHYWRGGEYRGLGVGAVSTVQHRRMKNVETMDAYIRLVSRGERPVGEVEVLGAREQAVERVMLSLRQRCGLDITELVLNTSASARERLQVYVTTLKKLYLAKQKGPCLTLTPRGYLKSNSIISYIVGLMNDG